MQFAPLSYIRTPEWPPSGDPIYPRREERPNIPPSFHLAAKGMVVVVVVGGLPPPVWSSSISTVPPPPHWREARRKGERFFNGSGGRSVGRSIERRQRVSLSLSLSLSLSPHSNPKRCPTPPWLERCENPSSSTLLDLLLHRVPEERLEMKQFKILRRYLDTFFMVIGG